MPVPGVCLSLSGSTLRGAAFAVLASMTLGVVHAQEKRWAAVDSNADASSPVAWGASEAEARRRAVDACKKVANTCSGDPAVTRRLDDVFADVCCRRPRLGCATMAAGSREEARKSIEELMTAAGYSNCSLRHYISAADGKQLEEATAPQKADTRRKRRGRRSDR